MMNFYYDPILGLQYSLGDPIIEIDVNAIPSYVTFEMVIDLIRSQGLYWVAKTLPGSVEEIFTINTNVK